MRLPAGLMGESERSDPPGLPCISHTALHSSKGNEVTCKSELKLVVTLKASKELKKHNNKQLSESVSTAEFGVWASTERLHKLKSPSDITVCEF